MAGSVPGIGDANRVGGTFSLFDRIRSDHGGWSEGRGGWGSWGPGLLPGPQDLRCLWGIRGSSGS